MGRGGIKNKGITALKRPQTRRRRKKNPHQSQGLEDICGQNLPEQANAGGEGGRGKNVLRR